MSPKNTDSNRAADDILRKSLANQRNRLAEIRNRANNEVLSTLRQEAVFRDSLDANAQSRRSSPFVQPRLRWIGAACVACLLLALASAYFFESPAAPAFEPRAERIKQMVSEDDADAQLMLLPPASETTVVRVQSGATLLVPAGTMIRPAQGSVRIGTPMQIRVSGT